MKHLKKGKTLKRNKSQRNALLRQLSRDFFSIGQIKSTEAKIKLLKPAIERIITKAKKITVPADKKKQAKEQYLQTEAKNLHLKRQLFNILQSKKIIKKIIEQIVPKYKLRQGGYTRIVKLGFRKGDNAPLARLEMV